jgi:hypothetical protein
MVMKMTEINLVVSPEDMDDETFAQHMAHRHADSMGGLKSISRSARTPGLMRAWRVFHDRLHQYRIDLPHEHEDWGRRAG